MKIFNSIGHAFAWILHQFLPAAQKVVTEVAAVADSPLGDAIAQLLGQKGTTAQAGVEAIAGDVLRAFEAAGQAIGANGLNVQFDTVTVKAIEALYQDVAGLFGKQTVAAQPRPKAA